MANILARQCGEGRFEWAQSGVGQWVEGLELRLEEGAEVLVIRIGRRFRDDLSEQRSGVGGLF